VSVANLLFHVHREVATIYRERERGCGHDERERGWQHDVSWFFPESRVFNV
jgi:hypothetical protein